MSRSPLRDADALDPRDGEVLARLAALWSRRDPPPVDLVARVSFGVALAEVEAEAQAALGGSDPAALAAHRGGDDEIRTLTFSSRERTIMVQITRTGRSRLRLDGWIEPAGPSAADLRVGSGQHSAGVSTAGRFHLVDLPRGTMQLTLRDDAGRVLVVTPSFEW